MSAIKITTLAVTLAVAGFAATVNSQGFWGRRTAEQNEPPATELIIARWRYGTNGRFGHMGWSHNYPNSDQNLNQHITEATGIDIERMSYRIVDLGSDEVFDYPFAYVSEPGEMELTDQEVINLREFVERGGFVLMDDFDGPDQLFTMREQVRRAFPERDFVTLTEDHRLFTAHFDLDDLEGMSPYVPGCYLDGAHASWSRCHIIALLIIPCRRVIQNYPDSPVGFCHYRCVKVYDEPLARPVLEYYRAPVQLRLYTQVESYHSNRPIDLDYQVARIDIEIRRAVAGCQHLVEERPEPRLNL